jgi:NADH dehydrogenase
MGTHILTASQIVNRPPHEVVPFFVRPQNLARITPPFMDLRIRSTDLDLREGLEIDYDLRPLPGFQTRWRARIVDLDPMGGFADIQVRGPYRRWTHRHTFAAVDGGTRVDDRVEYELPFGPLGDLADRIAVRPQLEDIFTHRARVIESVFEPTGQASSGDERTIAVAGGTGFVGGSIARELRRRGHRVVVLSSRGEEARGALPDDVEIRVIDVTTGAGLPEALTGLDGLVVAIAFRNSPMESPRTGQTFEAVDAIGTERLVDAARRQSVGSILYVSGAGAGPDAARRWFRAKWRAEEAVRGSGLRWTILRPTWIYGPGDVSLNRFIGFARRLPVVPLSNRGRQLLAPVFVEDVAAAAVDLLERPVGDRATFDVGGPEVLQMREIVRRAIRAAGAPRPIMAGPTPLIKLAAAPLSLLPRPQLTPSAVDFVNQPAVVDPAPLQEALGRRMRALDEGLATYLGRLPSGTSITLAEVA